METRKWCSCYFDNGADVNTLRDAAFKWAASLFCFEEGPRCCMTMKRTESTRDENNIFLSSVDSSRQEDREGLLSVRK